MRKFLLLILLTSLTLSSCISQSGKRKHTDSYVAVTRVVDGDTFWVLDGNEEVKIRLIGIDAPESRNTGRKQIGYYGQEAKEYLTEQLAEKKVKLELDVDPYDQYGRTLAYVYLTDGTFLNAELVKQGYAMVMTVPPNVKFAELFVKLQREARENNKGLWGGE